jgi:hypothetical protein
MQRCGGFGGRVSGQGCLVLVSLVNAFTNYRNVKGELRQKTARVTDVTHGLSVFGYLLRTPPCNVV